MATSEGCSVRDIGDISVIEGDSAVTNITPLEESVVNASTFHPQESSTPNKVTTKRILKVCDQCGKCYTSRYGLNLHIRGVHNGQFKFTCTICDKGFHHLWHYRDHVNHHHTLKPHKCECDKAYAYHKDLQKHQETCHVLKRELKLTCKDCQHISKSSSEACEHRLAQHGHTVYQCEKCYKTFKWRSSMRYHRNICK